MSERRGARWAVTVIFLAHAAPFASWTAHIPEVKRRLGLSDAALGGALLGAPIGSVVAMLVTPWLLARLGSRRMVQVSLAGYCAAGLGVGLASSQWQLFAGLAGWGLFLGALDESMNTQGITVQAAAGRPIMSGLHGAWSLGTFTGAALGAAGVAVGLR
jgi:MFS family permease